LTLAVDSILEAVAVPYFGGDTVFDDGVCVEVDVTEVLGATRVRDSPVVLSISSSLVDVRGAISLDVVEEDGLPVERNWRHFSCAVGVEAGFGREAG
jgi:hypothetical protein